jgi:alpha-galactosidase
MPSNPTQQFRSFAIYPIALAALGLLSVCPKIASAQSNAPAPAANITAPPSVANTTTPTAPVAAAPVPMAPVILTPPAPTTPRINGARVFGVRPGSPFLFTIPATGQRPMEFSAVNLPAGLTLDPATGRITGVLPQAGNFTVTLQAKNSLGQDERPLRIVVGDQIALTPAMGWNSWNCFADKVDQDKVLRAAQAMVSSGLAEHGWTYINIDDTWQGNRTGPDHALQSDPKKFPDMAALVAQIHQLGLKAGIYSTPWITSYALHAGGSADNPQGVWAKPTIPARGNLGGFTRPWTMGNYSFAAADARQWAAWGMDYLKYDWYPIQTPQVQEMSDALRASGRDIIFSLSNSAPFAGAADWARLANSWRTTGDIRDTWRSVSGIGFAQDKWAPSAGPGHWNDPDMLVVGVVGWGRNLHPSHLTPDEQYTHISLWCLLSAPLLLGCDLDKLDAFTLGLLTNDEVLAVDQDSLGHEATRVGGTDTTDVYAKPLADGSWAVGLFNRGPDAATVTVPWSELGQNAPQQVRDLWRQQDLGAFPNEYSTTVARHGVVLVRVSATH